MRPAALYGVVALLGMLPAAAKPCSPQIIVVTPSSDRLMWQSGCGMTVIEPWNAAAIHVQHLPAGAPAPMSSLAVTGVRQKTSFDVMQTTQEVVASTSELRIVASKADGKIRFERPDGTVLVGEDAEQSEISSRPDGLYRLTTSFFSAGTHYYGLGQHPTGIFNRFRTGVHLQQANGWTGLPFLLTDRGWGLLWDNASVSDVSLGLPQTGGDLRFSSEAGQAVEYYVVAGKSADDVIAGYRRLTGAAPLLPRWAWGFWQSFEHYATADELVGVAKRYRDMNVPINAVIQDWQYWQSGQWGAHRFDPARYPDPAKMVADIHALNMHAIVSVWARFDQDTDNRAELDKAGALFPERYRNVYPEGFGRWYDPFGVGRSLYWKQIARTLGQNGFDGWWLDASEAELGGVWGQMRDVTTAAGPGALVYNAYPLMHTAGVYEGARRDFPGKRPVILTRSAWAGQQRNAAISWSGDISGDWETFRRQIPAGLNFVSSGIPYWNTDIGGFFGGDPADPAYRELFVRWFQYGAFTPMFRVHGTGKPKEFWRFDASTQEILRQYDELRYRLLPYIYSVSWAVTDRGGSMMRPVFFDFSDDSRTLDLSDQFLFGPNLMVAPVTQAGADVRTVYLPGKSPWYDFWTGQTYVGVVAAQAPLTRMPLYVRAGTILPLGPVTPYADAKTGAPIELRIYRGADGHFILYDDSGDGLGYERGQRAEVEIVWNDATATLQFSDRKGTFPGMARKRTFDVVLVDADHGASVAMGAAQRRVVYRGKRLSVPLR